MQLPKVLPESQEDKLTLGLFYDTYNNRQWFERAEIVENHNGQMRKTLVLTVRYNPLLEMKEILSFTQAKNLAVDIISLDHSDTAVV